MKPTPNVASYLSIQALERPDAIAIIDPREEQQLTYRQLDDRSTLIARGLLAAGLKRGMRVALMVKPGVDLFSIVFALFKSGIVPVLIDPGIGLKHLGKCLAEARPEAFIGIPQAHLARALLGWARKSVRLRITTGELPLPGNLSLKHILKLGAQGPVLPENTDPSEMAAILFTSGSTGAPKGVVYSHAHFSAQVELIRETYGIQPGEVDLPTFPLFAIFDPALGMTTIIPDMDPTRPARANPVKILSAIEKYGVTHMFGSPALLNRVGRYGAAQGVKLPSVRRVLSAGAPVPAPVLERFAHMLNEGAKIFTPYGATESLPVSSIDSAEILAETRHLTAQGAGTCVGRPVKQMDVRIIGITDEPIPFWEARLALPVGSVGEIVVKGPVVTREYFGLSAATVAAKIPDPAGGFFHRMGDLGYFDEQGRLWFCGRKSHRVVTGTETLFTIPCEGVFNTHPAVFRTALVGSRWGDRGNSLPVLCVELEKGRRSRAELEAIEAELRTLASTHAHTRQIDQFLFHPSFPVDIRHNSKIFREKLTVWAGKRLP